MIAKAEISAYSVLFIGVALLAFTFVNAYLLLVEKFSILASPDFMKAFGEVLGPLVSACIRVMYLGVMGWIGSMITVRGVQLVTQLWRETRPEVKAEAGAEIKPETEEAKKAESQAPDKRSK